MFPEERPARSVRVDGFWIDRTPVTNDQFAAFVAATGHVTVMHIYCVIKGESISPRTMNTDTVEWFFRDARQMAGGSTNKLTVAGFDSADKKAITFNASNFSLLGNNLTGDTIFGRNKRF